MKKTQKIGIQIIVYAIICLNTNAQTLRKIIKLPSVVNETSGIEISGRNKIWTLNDSGGEPNIYLCDTLGNLIKTIAITGAWNRDWEDMCQDDQGNFYIGNIGNNNNNQTDLTIFKIPNPDKITGNSVAAQIIKYAYDDQYAFPPVANLLNFDCETIFWFNGHLFLCSKNRTYPFDGKTNLYRIPDAPGKYIAKKTSTFNTQGSDMFGYWITAGDISPDGKKLALLSSDKMWVFYNFTGEDFFNGQNRMIRFETNTQKESICFVDNNEVYITDEEWQNTDTRNLYSVKIPASIITSIEELERSSQEFLYPNPTTSILHLQTKEEGVDYQLYSKNGTLLLKGNGETLDLSGFEASTYFLKINGKVLKVIKQNQ